MDRERGEPLLDGPTVTHDLQPKGERIFDSVNGARLEKFTKDGSIREELKKQILIALPMVLVNLLQYSVLVVSIMFVGHMGELELAGASLANSIASVLGFYILMGMASALETLCGQAYGAKQYHMLEIYVQRGVFVLCCTCVPLTLVFLKMERILVLVGQTPEISATAAEYVFWLIPALFASAFLQPLVRFLQTQSIVGLLVFCSAATLALHAGLCWFIVFKLGLGYRGVAIATSISFWVNVVLLATFVKGTNYCEKTWVNGFSKEAFTDLIPFLRLASASSVMICLEYWSFEIVVLAAGLLPNPKLELSALSVCLNTTTLNYMIPLGLGAAASTRVSNELGAGNPDAVRRAMKVAMGMSVVQAICVSSGLFLARDIWGNVFSKEAEVVTYVSTIMPFLSSVVLFDGFQGVLSGVIRGAGWQDLGVLVNLGSFYVMGVPTGLVSAFYFGWAGKGLFTGILSGLGSQLLGLLIICLRTNWKEQVNDYLAWHKPVMKA